MSVRGKMPGYKLSARANADILDIFDWTFRTFGEYQAEAYHSGLSRTFGLIADFPEIGVRADELGASLRRFRFQSHMIFYDEGNNGVFIRALIHVRQIPRPKLFE